MADRHVNKCKECNKLDVVKNRASKLEYYCDYDRKRAQNPTRKSKRINRAFWAKLIVPDKSKARYSVSNAIRAGRLKKLPCEKCGCEKVQAHHHDYSKPLDVTWLCVKCHFLKHRKYNYDDLMKI
jgi:ribosomal protein S27AE